MIEATVNKSFPGKILLLVFSLAFFPIIVQAQIFFPLGSNFKFLRGNEVHPVGEAWRLAGYDDSDWEMAASPFWYGDGQGGTELSDMQNSYTTFYLRSEFVADHINEISRIRFEVDYDDAFVLWINGKEVFRDNVPAVTDSTSLALMNHESGQVIQQVLDSSQVLLLPGMNQVAVQVFNVSMESSDIHFNMALFAEPSLHDSLQNVIFSHPAGFYDDAFFLRLSSPMDGAEILYTLDGSNPASSATASQVESGSQLLIDPSYAPGRARTPAIAVRAAVKKEGFAVSIPRTRTYIFPTEVKAQSYPGGAWPSGNINGQVIDLEMDPDIVNDSRYKNLIDSALLAIPSLSLVSSNGNFFDTLSGIYVNAQQYGDAWERECSLELIDPNGDGFQVNAGMRIRGGASRADYNAKHAFRIFFREVYGDDKLYYPLFGKEGTDEFDKIDIRTEQNYSWARAGGSVNVLNNFVKDIFSRKMQGLMGQPYTRSRYYHLYLNGMYWGIFMTEERPEARFAESYLGGEREDYDVVKITTHTWPYQNIATDGNMEAWEEVWNLCQAGFESDEMYFKLEGRDANGEELEVGKVLVDLDNLIDYMCMIFYTGSFDAPVSAFAGEAMPNNYYALYNRQDSSAGFKFVAHDQEHGMLSYPILAGDGLYENRVTIPEMRADGLLQFQPQWLHTRLMENAVYRQRFTDRAYYYFFENGLFTPDFVDSVLQTFSTQIDLAIIAESARWGDTHVSTPRTREDWRNAIRMIREDFFPFRTDIVISQLEDVGIFFPLMRPPDLEVGGKKMTKDTLVLQASSTLLLRNPNNHGGIYYTLDGSDPMAVDGSPTSSAIYSPGVKELTLTSSAIVNTRIISGSAWSPPRQLTILFPGDYSQLRVTELHYHPPDMTLDGALVPGTELEFIELKNVGLEDLDISGISLDSAVSFQLPVPTVIEPDSFYVAASNATRFEQLHGRKPSAVFERNFSNDGELVLISDINRNEILSFRYSDDAPWPFLAAGRGHSLTAVDLDGEGNPASYSYWRDSYRVHGSPFMDDLPLSMQESSIEMEHFLLYPNPARSSFTIAAALTGEEVSFRIYDSTGKLCHQGCFFDEIHLEKAELGTSGIYFIDIRSSGKREVLKLVLY